MSVCSLKPYHGIAADTVGHYHGQQLIYLSWDHHLMFAAPFVVCVPPDLRFQDLVDTVLSPLIAADPDATEIRWEQVSWRMTDQPFSSTARMTLAENGIGHKALLRFHTPGLNSLCGEPLEGRSCAIP